MTFWKDAIAVKKRLAELHEEHQRGLLPVEHYVLILEDKRFFHHPGFDVQSIVRALFKWSAGQKGGGASTIEQQLVRTITGRREKTLKRKLREIALAALIRAQFDKMDILNAYLKIAYFGTNLKGIEQASLALFRRSANELRPIEAAFVASLLLYPAPLKPTPRWIGRANRRARYAMRFDNPSLGIRGVSPLRNRSADSNSFF